MTQPADGAQSGAEAENVQGDGAATDLGSTAPYGAQSGATQANTAETVSKADYQKALERMRAADKRASDRENELKQIRDKDLPEMEKLKRDFEEIRAENEKLRANLQEGAIERAFLKDNNHRWKDQAAALKLVDMSGVEVADDGSVTGLKDALNRLAKDKAWMLEEKEADEGSGARPSSGAPPMNGRPGTNAPNKSGLEKVFPALRTRRQAS